MGSTALQAARYERCSLRGQGCGGGDRRPCRTPDTVPPLLVGAVRDDRRAELPGGHIKLARGEYAVTAPDEALEVRALCMLRLCACRFPAARSARPRSFSCSGATTVLKQSTGRLRPPNHISLFYCSAQAASQWPGTLGEQPPDVGTTPPQGALPLPAAVQGEPPPFRSSCSFPSRQAMEVPPTQGKTHRWTKPRSILEQDNNGYTL